METPPSVDELKIEDEPRSKPVLPQPESSTDESVDEDHNRIEDVSGSGKQKRHVSVLSSSKQDNKIFGENPAHQGGLFGWLREKKKEREIEISTQQKKAEDEDRRKFERFKIETLDYLLRLGNKGEITLARQLRALSGVGNEYDVAKNIRESAPVLADNAQEQEVSIACILGLMGVDDELAWKKRGEMLILIESHKINAIVVKNFVSALSRSLACLGTDRAEDYRKKLRKLGATKRDLLLSYMGVDNRASWREREVEHKSFGWPDAESIVLSTTGIDSEEGRKLRESIIKERYDSFDRPDLVYSALGSNKEKQIKNKVLQAAVKKESKSGEQLRELLLLRDDIASPVSFEERMLDLKKIEEKYSIWIPPSDILQNLLGYEGSFVRWLKKYGDKKVNIQIYDEDETPNIEIIKEQKLEGGIGEQVSKAEQILGKKKVHLPEEMGIEFEKKEMLPIPFTVADLERAKLLGQHLIYRVSEENETPLTIENLAAKYEQEFHQDGFEEVVMGFKRHQDENEKYFNDDTPRLGWALIDTEALDYTYGANLTTQTDALIKYLTEDVYAEREVPDKYKKAIETFFQKKEEIESLLESTDVLSRVEGNKKLEMLEITQMLRPWPVEALYDTIALWKEGQNCYKHFILTSRRHSARGGGSFVTVEGFGNVKLGASVGTSYGSNAGSAMSRRF